jgi:hypothetical protein
MTLEFAVPACRRSQRVSAPPPLAGYVVTDATPDTVEPEADALPTLHQADELLSRSEDDGPLPGRTGAETLALLQVARWSKDFLTNPHPALGRSGHVCPYVAATLREQRLLLTLLRHAATRPDEVDEVMLRLGQFFLELEPTAGRLAHRKTIIVLFQDLSALRAADVINGMHQRLKPHFLRQGLMLGEFYKESSKPGLHNPEFRPLRSDTPLLVIRAMVLTDIAFLSDDPSFVEAFLDHFGARGCVEVHGYLERHGHALCRGQVAILLEQIAQFEAGPHVHTT